MLDQPFMNFEIREKIKHFNDGQSFQELSSLELEPIVKIYDSDKQIDVSGHLVLSGEFLKKDDNWEEQIDQADGIHYGSFFIRDKEIETFQHQIPISFDIQLDRVENPSEVYVLVENFDYNVISYDEMELTAKIRLVGVHPKPTQENQAYLDYYREDEGNPSIDEASAYKTTSEEIIQDEQSEEAAQDSQDESEEVTIQFSSTTEKTADLEKPDQHEKSKMKIGIQVKNQVIKEKETETKEENPLYSLLKREQKKDIEQIEVKTKDNVETEKEESIVISMEDYLNEKEEDVKLTIDKEQSQEVENEVEEQLVMETKTTTRATKDMLYNLLQGNEEKKFKLKIYLVQKEDTLEQVAEKYDVKHDDLLKYNSLASRDLQEGQLLYLPMER